MNNMIRQFVLSVVLLSALCVNSPAPTVNFASPPFSTDFIVNQPGNSIAIRFPGVTNVAYIPGTFGYISNQTVYIGTNNFSGGGGGGGGSGITTLSFTNSSSPSVIGTNGFIPNYVGINNTFTGDQTFNEISAATLDGGAGTLTVNLDGGTLTSGAISITASTISITGGTMMSSAGFTGNGANITNLNASELRSGTVPTARMGTGTANGLTFLRGDNTWDLVITNVVATNAGPQVLVLNDTAFINTNAFGGGGGSGITQLTGDGTAGPGSGSQALTLATVMASPGIYRSVTVNGKGLVTAGSNPTTFAGYGISDTWNNLAAALTGLIPQSALGTGSGGTGAKFLSDAQTYTGIPVPDIITNGMNPAPVGGQALVYNGTGFAASNVTANVTNTFINPLVSTNTGTFFAYSIYGTGTLPNTNAAQFGFDGTNEAFRIQGQYNGSGSHTNITVWSQGYNIPVQQAGQTNVSLVAATSQAILFLHPMPSTNYVPFVTAGSATAIAGFSPSAFTVNGFTANFTSLTLSGRLLWTVTAYTQ